MTKILPLLNIPGAALVVVATVLFSAIHSPLGQEISAGEGPGFAWIQANVIACIGVVPVYLILAGYSIDPPYDDPHMGIFLVPIGPVFNKPELLSDHGE